MFPVLALLVIGYGYAAWRYRVKKSDTQEGNAGERWRYWRRVSYIPLIAVFIYTLSLVSGIPFMQFSILGNIGEFFSLMAEWTHTTGYAVSLTQTLSNIAVMVLGPTHPALSHVLAGA